MYTIHSFTTETLSANPDMIDKLYNFCERQSTETKYEASRNMSIYDWQNNSASLFYVIFKEGRFSKGRGIFNIVLHGDTIVSVAGAYVSDFSSDIIIGGVRTWTDKEHRSRFIHGGMIMPTQYEWAFGVGKMYLLSFNDYNIDLMNLVLRFGTNRSTKFGTKNAEFYKDFIKHPTRLLIKNVPQWVLYKKIDTTWNYDFAGIEV